MKYYLVDAERLGWLLRCELIGAAQMGAVDIISPENKEEFLYTSQELLKEFMLIQLKTEKSGKDLVEQWTREKLEEYGQFEF